MYTLGLFFKRILLRRPISIINHSMTIASRLVSLLKISTVSERRFFADLLRLTSLAAIAKIITVLTLPFLSRLYDPEDFGLLSGYVAMLGFVACIGAFKIEFTVSLPRSLRRARFLLAAALVMSLVIIVLIALFVFLAWPRISPAYDDAGLLACFLISSMGVLWFSIFRQWLTRMENYTAIGMAQCRQSLAQIGVRAVIPVFNISTALPGLIIGDVAGRLVMAYATWRASARFAILRYMRSFRIWLAVLNPYKKHCLTHTVSSLLNELPTALLPLTVIYFYRETQAGYVSMAYQAVQAAANVLIVAAAQVFFGNITQLFHQQPQLVHGRFWRLIGQLSLLMLPGIVIVLACGPWLFALVFGEKWERAGVYCQLLLPILVMQLVAGPVLNLLVLTRRIHRQCLVNFVWVSATFCLIGINLLQPMDITLYLAWFSGIAALIYLWLVVEINNATKNL